MYGLYGANEAARNLYRLGVSRGVLPEKPTTQDLRVAYLDLLAEYQPKMPVNYGENIFVFDPDTETALVNAYPTGGVNALDDMRQSEILAREALPMERKLQHARRVADVLLDMTEEDEAFGYVFSLIVHSIFLRDANRLPGIRSSFGGSSGGCIGAIWFVPDDTVTRVDQMELLVHELTHHLLFVDEMAHAQFDYSKIVLKEYYAHSAILKQSRPLDKVVHSIVVATEILLWRMRTREPDDPDRVVHPSSRQLLDQATAAMQSVYEVKNINEAIKPRIWEILERCQAAWREIAGKLASRPDNRAELQEAP